MKYYRKENNVIELPDEETAPEGFVKITKTKYDRICEILRTIPEKLFELKKTDFKALKYAEGWISDEEYAPIKALRQSLRDEINALKAELE